MWSWTSLCLPLSTMHCSPVFLPRTLHDPPQALLLWRQSCILSPSSSCLHYSGRGRWSGGPLHILWKAFVSLSAPCWTRAIRPARVDGTSSRLSGNTIEQWDWSTGPQDKFHFRDWPNFLTVEIFSGRGKSWADQVRVTRAADWRDWARVVQAAVPDRTYIRLYQTWAWIWGETRVHALATVLV